MPPILTKCSIFYWVYHKNATLKSVALVLQPIWLSLPLSFGRLARLMHADFLVAMPSFVGVLKSRGLALAMLVMHRWYTHPAPRGMSWPQKPDVSKGPKSCMAHFGGG